MAESEVQISFLHGNVSKQMVRQPEEQLEGEHHLHGNICINVAIMLVVSKVISQQYFQKSRN